MMKFFPLVLAGLMRKPAITSFSFFAIVIAFLLFGLLKSIDYAFKNVIETSFNTRLYVSNKASLNESLPIKYAGEIARVDGVNLVSHEQYFDAYFQNEKQDIFVFAIDPAIDFDIYPEQVVDPAAVEKMKVVRDGCIVGRPLLDRFGWKVGDKIALHLAGALDNTGSEDHAFTIVGTYAVPSGDAPEDITYVNYDYVNQLRITQRDAVSMFVVTLKDGIPTADVAKKIDIRFANSSFETRTQDEKAFFQGIAKQMGDIGIVMNFIIAAVFFSMILLIATTMTQNFRSRTAELAVLKTLGFTDIEVLLLLFAETVLLCLLGALFGMIAASGLGIMTTHLAPQLAKITGAIQVPVDIFLGGMLLALTIAIGVAAAPAFMAKRLKIVDALKVR